MTWAWQNPGPRKGVGLYPDDSFHRQLLLVRYPSAYLEWLIEWLLERISLLAMVVRFSSQGCCLHSFALFSDSSTIASLVPLALENPIQDAVNAWRQSCDNIKWCTMMSLYWTLFAVCTSFHSKRSRWAPVQNGWHVAFCKNVYTMLLSNEPLAQDLAFLGWAASARMKQILWGFKMWKSIIEIDCWQLSCFTSQKKFTQRSDRVKGVDLHPTEPWWISALLQLPQGLRIHFLCLIV